VNLRICRKLSLGKPDADRYGAAHNCTSGKKSAEP
jgi:hypothetical protein